MGVSRPTVERAERFADGANSTEEVSPGITKDIVSGKIKPKQADLVAITKALAGERKQMAKIFISNFTETQLLHFILIFVSWTQKLLQINDRFIEHNEF